MSNSRPARRKMIAASDGHKFTIIGACCVTEVEIYANGHQKIRHDDGCPVLADKGSPESIRARVAISQAVCMEAERLGHGKTMGLVEATPGKWFTVTATGVLPYGRMNHGS